MPIDEPNHRSTELATPLLLSLYRRRWKALFSSRDEVRVLTLRDEISPIYKPCLRANGDEFTVNPVMAKGTRVA